MGFCFLEISRAIGLPYHFYPHKNQNPIDGSGAADGDGRPLARTDNLRATQIWPSKHNSRTTEI